MASKKVAAAAAKNSTPASADAVPGKRKAASPAKRKRGGETKSAKKPRRRRGGAAAILEGWWQLDVERSDTMQNYLSSMGLNETAVQAALKGERDMKTLHCFKIKSTSVTIERRSRMGNNTTKLMYNKPLTTTMSTGTKTMTATKLPNGVIQIKTQMPLQSRTVIITDTRSVQDNVLHQVLVTEGDDASTRTETRRYYNKTEDPGPLPVKGN